MHTGTTVEVSYELPIYRYRIFKYYISMNTAVALSHTLPYSNGIPEQVIWVESDSDEDNPPVTHESSSVISPSPTMPSRPTYTDPDTEHIVHVPAHYLGHDYILWANNYTAHYKPGQYDADLDAFIHICAP